MSTPVLWVIALLGAALLMAGGSQIHHRPKVATALIITGLVPVIVGSQLLWSRTGVFG